MVTPTSPFAASSSIPGHGTVHLTLLPPSTPTFSTLSYTYPLKLLPSTPHTIPRLAAAATTASSPSSPPPPTTVPLLFFLTYGGGLLPPDNISLTLTLAPSTRLVITTQGSTKIFPSPSANPSAIASQTLTAHLAPHSALLIAPDPTQPFRDSRYHQHQSFEVAEGASLALLDWVSEGRRARGESWVAGEWRGRNEVWRLEEGEGERKSRLLLRDNVVLVGERDVGEMGRRMEGCGVFGTVVLLGPVVELLGAFFLEEFGQLPRIGGRKWEEKNEREEGQMGKWRRERWRAEEEDGVLWTVAKVRGLVLVKFGAREVEGARRWLGSMWRAEGTVGREFGEGGLMCVR